MLQKLPWSTKSIAFDTLGWTCPSLTNKCLKCIFIQGLPFSTSRSVWLRGSRKWLWSRINYNVSHSWKIGLPHVSPSKNMATCQNREELLTMTTLRQHTQNEFPLIGPLTNQSRCENQLVRKKYICLFKHSIRVCLTCSLNYKYAFIIANKEGIKDWPELHYLCLHNKSLKS